MNVNLVKYPGQSLVDKRIPDQTGPHGRGLGPGQGQADGTGVSRYNTQPGEFKASVKSKKSWNPLSGGGEFADIGAISFSPVGLTHKWTTWLGDRKSGLDNWSRGSIAKRVVAAPAYAVIGFLWFDAWVLKNIMRGCIWVKEKIW